MRATPDLDELYAVTYKRLVVQLFAICGDLADAEDAVQEAFVTAVRKHRELVTTTARLHRRTSRLPGRQPQRGS
jgi:DNA-directed RNA polymerase specialized sigma24 family protein